MQARLCGGIRPSRRVVVRRQSHWHLGSVPSCSAMILRKHRLYPTTATTSRSLAGPAGFLRNSRLTYEFLVEKQRPSFSRISSSRLSKRVLSSLRFSRSGIARPPVHPASNRDAQFHGRKSHRRVITGALAGDRYNRAMTQTQIMLLDLRVIARVARRFISILFMNVHNETFGI